MAEKKDITKKVTTKKTTTTKTNKIASKKTPTKKTPKKKNNIADDIEKIQNDQPVMEQPIGATIEEQIKNVNTEIKDETNKIDEIEQKIQDELEPVIEIAKEVDEVVSDKGEFAKKTEHMTNDELKEYSQEQLNKAIAIRNKLKKIITKRTPNSFITSWWNGSGYNE